MKTLTIFSALMALSSLAFFSCQGNPDATTTSDAATNVTPWNPEDPFVIDSTEAVGYINDYQLFNDSIIEVLSNGDPSKAVYFKARLTYGARIYIHELQAMMDTVKAHVREGDRDADSASLYIMMASMPGTASVDSTHTIFNLQRWKSGGGRVNTFFDFVRPCPTSCPSWFRQ